MDRFIRMFLNNERVIQQMADSHIIRRAARFFVSGLYSARSLVGQSSLSRRVQLFTKTFKQEYSKSLKDK